MAVNFTSNIGLAKPDETEIARNWADFTELCEDNNVAISLAARNLLTTYTPTWIGPTTNPSFGAGSISAEYLDFQGFIFGSFAIQCTDPGVAAGSGTGGYGISLPLLADSTFHTVGGSLSDNPGNPSVIGEGYISDASSVNLSQTVAVDLITIAGVSYARLLTETYSGKTSRFFGPANPFTLATGDQFSCSYVYKKA